MKKIIAVSLLLFSFVILLVTSCSKDEDLMPHEDEHGHGTHFHIEEPDGFPEMEIPEDNETTVEGIALGRKLFYEKLLSGDNTMSCASCHRQSFAFSDTTTAFSIGIDGLPGTRNAMPVFNLGWTETGFFWDGGASDIESQVIGPIQNPVEMHEDLATAVAELQAHPEYPGLFHDAFGTNSITTAQVMKAIAQFERTMISANSRYDKYVRGEPGGWMNPQELSGMNLFSDMSKGDCNHCHVLGSTFTDFEFKNTGLDSIPVDQGRYLITLLNSDRGKFKTPSLRNIELTAPYMHDGRFQTLDEVIDHYNTGFRYAANLDPNLYFAVKGRMSAQEKADIIAFLKTLTDYEFLTDQRFSDPN